MPVSGQPLFKGSPPQGLEDGRYGPKLRQRLAKIARPAMSSQGAGNDTPRMESE